MEVGAEEIYHEKQRLQFCLLHALNNLFQGESSFTRAELDAIANQFVLEDPVKENWKPLTVVFKPHHNTLTGNYDVHVLIAALEGKGKTVIWHDRRKGASSIDLNQSDEALLGVMLNVSVKRFGGIWRSRHWVSLRRINGIWYNLDSDLSAPKPFKHPEEMQEFLEEVFNQGVVSGDMRLMGSSRKLKRRSLNSLLLFVSLFVIVSCVLVLLISTVKLPEVSVERNWMGLPRTLNVGKKLEVVKIGPLGEFMLDMLPEDLAFTVFIPSENAFERDLKLRANDSLSGVQINNTYAVLSRVLSFTAVPQHLSSRAVQPDREISLDSISGLKLFVSKGWDKTLIVNTIPAEQVDIRRKDIMIHIMNGVIMDAEFEQSFESDDDEED